jgi:hypothetical protein
MQASGGNQEVIHGSVQHLRPIISRHEKTGMREISSAGGTESLFEESNMANGHG